ncbi:MAG: alpha-ketoacid dehydrogenase subunit beta [Actinomycetota bacterium]
MPEITLVQAVTMALHHEMAADGSVVVLGEDVGASGGVFRATDGLQERFGPDRVIDTPLAETLIAGLAVGLAAEGMRPVAEIQFSGFLYSTFDQLINHASRLRNRTRGRLTCPMVLRSPCGGGIKPPEHHSDSPEALLAGVPGLKVVVPSSPAAAYGLLLAAIRDPDPVVVLEPTRLYRAGKEEVADDGAALPLGMSFVLRDGTDLTLVAWGGMVPETLAAADELAAEGVSAAVIDVASIAPLDMEPILESVARTGRCVIVHEAARIAGFGAEIAARLAEEGLNSLLAPVARVTGWDTIFPLPRLEGYYMPDRRRVLAAAHRVLEAA